MGKDYTVQCSSNTLEVASGRIYTKVVMTSIKIDGEEVPQLKVEKIPILKFSYNSENLQDACNLTQAAAFSLAQFLDRYQSDTNVKEIFIHEGDSWILKYSQENADGGISIEKNVGDGIIVRLVPLINERTGYPCYNIYILYKDSVNNVKMINIEKCMINDLKNISRHLFVFAYNCPLYSHIYVDNRRWALLESTGWSAQEMSGISEMFKK